MQIIWPALLNIWKTAATAGFYRVCQATGKSASDNAVINTIKILAYQNKDT